MIAGDYPEEVRLAGRDVSRMEIIVQVGNGLTAEPRMLLTGSIEQIQEDF